MESYAYFKREVKNFTKLSSFFLEQLDQSKYSLFSNPTPMLFSMYQLNHIFVNFLVNWYLNKKLYRHGLEGAKELGGQCHHLQAAWLRPEAASLPRWSVAAILSEFRPSSSADDSQALKFALRTATWSKQKENVSKQPLFSAKMAVCSQYPA